MKYADVVVERSCVLHDIETAQYHLHVCNAIFKFFLIYM